MSSVGSVINSGFQPNLTQGCLSYVTGKYMLQYMGDRWIKQVTTSNRDQLLNISPSSCRLTLEAGAGQVYNVTRRITFLRNVVSHNNRSELW